MAMALSVIGMSSHARAQSKSEIRLILQITVDGFRGDLLNRYGDRFAKAGFRYLLEHGTVFANAHYQHANTETIVGHTTLATGHMKPISRVTAAPSPIPSARPTASFSTPCCL